MPLEQQATLVLQELKVQLEPQVQLVPRVLQEHKEFRALQVPLEILARQVPQELPPL